MLGGLKRSRLDRGSETAFSGNPWLALNPINARRHDFSRAGKGLTFVISSGLQPVRDLLFRRFSDKIAVRV